MKKLTMVSVNGRVKFLMLPVCEDGKVRCDIFKVFGLNRNHCIYRR